MQGDMIPKRQTTMSAGYDFYMPYDLTLRKGWFRRKWYMIDTGVRLEDKDSAGASKRIVNEDGIFVLSTVPRWFMMLVPRSGLSIRNGTEFRNTVGIIDQDYRDTIKICVSVDKTLKLKKGERFMQGIIIPWLRFIDEVEPGMKREGGHGSTGQ